MNEYKIKKQASAGTLESSDIQIIIDTNPNDKIEIELTSTVQKQYGRKIRQVILDTLAKMNITSAKLLVTDKGALDCTIIARTISAVHRASEIASNYDWEDIDTWIV